MTETPPSAPTSTVAMSSISLGRTRECRNSWDVRRLRNRNSLDGQALLCSDHSEAKEGTSLAESQAVLCVVADAEECCRSGGWQYADRERCSRQNLQNEKITNVRPGRRRVRGAPRLAHGP